MAVLEIVALVVKSTTSIPGREPAENGRALFSLAIRALDGAVLVTFARAELGYRNTPGFLSGPPERTRNLE